MVSIPYTSNICNTKFAKFLTTKGNRMIHLNYGEFDRILYNIEGRISGGWYLAKEEKVGHLETAPAKYYAISFNSEGIATRVRIDEIPGG